MPVLTPSECSALLLLLNNTSRSFGTAANEFRSTFKADDILRACCSICLLLEEEQLLPLHQRLVLWYILWDSHKDKSLKNNPFISFQIQAATTEATPSIERVLLHQLLSSGHLKSVSNQTPHQYCTTAKVTQLSSAKDAAALIKQYLGASHTPKGAASRTARGSSDAGGSSGSGSSAPARQTLAAAALHLPAVARHHAATHPAQPAADGGLGPPGGSGGSSSSGSGAQSGRAGSTAAAGSSGSSSSDPALSGAGARPSWAPALVPAAPLSSAADPWLLQHVQQLSPAGLQPPWQRPRPPLLAASPGEFKWVHTELPQVLLWDNTMGEDPRRGQALRELVSKALQGPLLPAQQQLVLVELAADPALVHQLGLTPQQLPALVENTPVLAYEVLLRLMASPDSEEYFQVLARMDMSLHSMEVVNRLTSAVDLPTEFVHLYITNCINSCGDIQDKYLQNRLVRLVCVFLQSLIRNKIINIQDLLHEVQAFCINFSRIREAAALFRLLKQIEAGGVVPGGRMLGDAMSSPGSMEGSSSCSPGPEEVPGGAGLHVQLELGRGVTPARA